MKKLFFKGLLFCLALLISAVLSYADVQDKIPKTINVQGKLTTDSGQPISGQKNVTLYIYSDEEGTTEVVSKEVTVERGPQTKRQTGHKR